MEGTLLKWTNYYNGWQPRYFVLYETGVLSYYKSSELIHEGCKGSCLVVACEVKVHPHDPLRFDLIIPGEQFFCLKSKSQPERQRWLVALGTCKARGTKSTTSTTTISNNNKNTSSTFISHLNTIDHELKIKVQELRLYETVLTERIHTIKSIANDTPIPDVKKLDESSSMLSVTCDAFIHTLDECVKLATGDSSQSLLLLCPSLPKLPDGISTLRQSFNEIEPTKSPNSTIQIIYKTFFSQIRYTFAKLSCLPFKEIPSELFLSTCEQYLALIDKFNSTTFIPLRADANGNISKLRRKISNDPNKFQTLYSIVNDERTEKITKEKNSATDALLWLKRAIHFLACFLHEFGQGDQSVEDAMNKAYGQTLKRFHGWITRGVFSIALRSVPYNEDFLVALAIDPNDAREVLFERQILNEMLEHSSNMNIVVQKITDFYNEHELESDEIINKNMKVALNEEKDKNHLLPRKKRRQLERKLIKAKRNAWQHREKIPMSINGLSSLMEEEENSIKEKKKRKKKKKSKDKASELTIDEETAKNHHRKILIEDNQAEDTHIKKLERLLGIKSDRKTYLRGFVDDGLDFLLDFCDNDRRKQIMLTEGDGEGNAWYDNEDEDQQWLANKQKQKVELANQAEQKEENNNKQDKAKKKKITVVKFNEQIQTKMIDNDDSIEDEEDFDEQEDDFDEPEDDLDEQEDDFEETPVLKEDIYGRTIDAKGTVVKNNSSTTYIPPALRQKVNPSDDNSSIELKRRLQGQLNRLSEKNLSSILIEIETLYRSQSRASINSCLYQLYHDSLLSSLSLTGESLLAEHALLASLFHANIGLEIGSYLLENFLQIFVEHINDEVSNKINDNLIIFLSYLYAFYMTNGKILFEIARYLLNIDQLNEKRLELILLLLKTSGFLLRKDDPLELKTFLQELRTACSSSTLISSSSKRLEFMMETIKSLKNNDVRKLPGGFEPERIDRLRKIYRNLVKDKTVQQANMLNVGLQDFLNAKEQGRWWIVGSAWHKQSDQDKKKNNKQPVEQQFTDKIRKLAKQQHMNTDIRRLIFGTLLTSEDCDDAVEKLHKLNLSKVQEREIIHVTVHCCIHEKTYNPYYTLILQRFCGYDRRFQISLQYHTWDRFKDLSLLNDQQLANFGAALAQLLISKSITLNIFKNFNFIELTSSARTFLVELFVKLFNDIDDISLKSIFQFPSTQNYKFVKDAFRLFLSHFILKKSTYTELVHHRCQIAIDRLSIE